MSCRRSSWVAQGSATDGETRPAAGRAFRADPIFPTLHPPTPCRTTRDTPGTMPGMKQRLSLSLDERRARYLQRCADRRTNGNASAYVDELLAREEMREAAAAMGRWYAAQPAAETEAFLDAVESELASLDPAEQQAALLRLGL